MHPTSHAVLLLLLPGSVGFRLTCPAPAGQQSAFSRLPAAVCAEGEVAEADGGADSASMAWDGETILTCSKCKAAFTIDPAQFGKGRTVSCGNCGHEWFQTAERLQKLHSNMELVEYPESMRCAALPHRYAAPSVRPC